MTHFAKSNWRVGVHFSLVLHAILLFGSDSVSAQEQGSKGPGIEFSQPLAWQARFQGIDFAEITVAKPVIMRGFAARVDLKEAEIGFVVTAHNGARKGETDGLRTSNFLKETNCQLAINANPFSPVHLAEEKAQDVSGLLVSKGKVISPAEKGLPALLFGAGNKAAIGLPPFDLSKVSYAVGGFSIILKNGVITTTREKRHPRTAAGISRDGRYLYLLVIDGRQPKYSQGAATPEVADRLKRLGASEGINLDGGGTSTFVLSGTKRNAKVMNRPIHLGIPGTERPSGAHLGIRARALAARKE